MSKKDKVLPVEEDNSPVASTSHIFFDEDILTFYIYSGSSLYSFSISPELLLEHLYFGPLLSRGFDLRFSSNSSRTLAFNTIQSKHVYGLRNMDEIPKVALEEDESEMSKQCRDGLCESLLGTMTIRELAIMHKKHRNSDTENLRRRANLAWRALGFKLKKDSGPLTENDINEVIMQTASKTPTPLSSTPGTPRGRSASDEEGTSPAGGTASVGIRFRSVSAPDLSSAKQIVEDIKLQREQRQQGACGAPGLLDQSLDDPLHVGAEGRGGRRLQLRGNSGLDEPSSVGGDLFKRKIGDVGKGILCLEYSDHGTGDFRSPSFSVADSYNDSTSSPLRFRSYQIYKGTLPMPDALPGIRCRSPDEASTLVVKMLDTVSGLEVDLIYTTLHAYDCITRRVVFHNVDKRPLMRKESMTGGPGSAASNPKDASCSFRHPPAVEDEDEGAADFCDFDHGGGGCRPSHQPLPAAQEQNVRQDVVSSDEDSPVGSYADRSDDVSRIEPRTQVRGSCNSGHQYRCGAARDSKECYKIVTRAMSMTLDMIQSKETMYLTQLSGSWGRERHKTEVWLEQGMHSFGSSRGVSSHQANPFCAISDGPPHEQHGEVRGFALAYSGNFLVEAETDEMRRTRINIGLHPDTTQWHLGRGGVFNTPEALLVRSSQGLGGMSRVFHRIINDRLMPRSWADTTPPIILNTWEAMYFNVTAEGVLDLARYAKPVGVDLLVIDDGWFSNRESDCAGLGDWQVCPVKFPQGLGPVAQELNRQGIRLGIWLEPEMVSLDSHLARQYPDWYLSEPGRESQVGRNQMVLDMSRGQVRNYLFDTISRLLNSANIEFIKWDMNRPLTDVFSNRVSYRNKDGRGAAPNEINPGNLECSASPADPIFQSETSHRYVLGLYALLARVIEAFPHLVIETCSSGGGRFDLGMLYYSAMGVWTSDNTDAVERLRIQHGTSLVYPFRSMGAHVSTVPNHITGNTTRARARGFVSMTGSFGFELDLRTATEAELVVYGQQVRLFRQIRHIIRHGELYRLWDPARGRPLCGYMFVHHDKEEAVVFAYSVNSDHWST